jgi:hypothetical protein
MEASHINDEELAELQLLHSAYAIGLQQYRALENAFRRCSEALRERYGLTEADQVEISTGRISRAVRTVTTEEGV